MSDARDLLDQPGSRWRLSTPALVVDLDALEANIARMAARARAAGVALRPHAKTHKSAFVARLQVEAGAVGVCCAKLGEAEALARAGVRGLLVTSPVASRDVAARAATLGRTHPDLRLVLDHADGAAALAQAVAAADAGPLEVLIDVDVGLSRTGVADAQAAVRLARDIEASSGLRLVGVQGYGGHWQHVVGEDARRGAVETGMRRLSETLDALRAEGHACPVVTGGGTGTFAADVALGVLNELQPGSYVFMDRQYGDALGGDADGAFADALFVQAQVISANAPAWVTVDAGLKAFATDGPPPRPATAPFAGLPYFYFGDEHGGLARPGDGGEVRLGQRVEFLTPHCDPTVDRYDRVHIVRGDRLVAVQAIEAARRSQ